MKLKRTVCPYCDYEGKPLKATRGRVHRRGMTLVCANCRGPVE